MAYDADETDDGLSPEDMAPEDLKALTDEHNHDCVCHHCQLRDGIRTCDCGATDYVENMFPWLNDAKEVEGYCCEACFSRPVWR